MLRVRKEDVGSALLEVQDPFTEVAGELEGAELSDKLGWHNAHSQKAQL